MFFLAHILNRPVVDAAGVRLGWVEDLVLTGLELFPRVAAIVLARRGRGAVFIPWEKVDEFSDRVVRLSTTRDELVTTPLDNEAIFLRRDILDKQVVDIHGRKVVRVNDLTLADIDHQLRLIGADIGARGVLRRLNLERPVHAISRTLNAELLERVIPWNYVEGLETEWPSVRLNISHRRLKELPAPDIADIIAQLQPAERDELLLHIDDETLADTLPHLEDDIQADVIEAMTDERASDIMEILPPDEAADVLGDLPEARAERILHLMEEEEAADVRELLQYGDKTAGGRMTTDYLAFSQEMTVDQVLTALREQAPDAEAVYYVYVTDALDRLEGVVSLRDLITATGDTPLSDLAGRDIIAVNVNDDQETAAHVLNHYHLLAVPVVDDDNVLRGMVTVDDVLDVMHEEAEEDIHRLVGAVEEGDVLATPLEQATLRMPWLLGSALAGMFIAVYLTMRSSVPAEALTPLLALLPLLLLVGVQIGGQGAAVTTVALADGNSLGEIIQRLMQRQWPVGLILSVLSALAGGLFTHFVSGRAFATAVGGVILLVLIVDMLVGSLLPLLLHRLRWDPVLVSRPALAVLALLIGVPLLAQVL
ncbi:MAG: magnesium transporter [Armatimonadota bacterium]